MQEEKVCMAMTAMEESETYWYAIRTRQDFRAETVLADKCDEVFFPKERVKTPGGAFCRKAVIPHVLFIRTTHDRAVALEECSRRSDSGLMPFWIYRYVKGGDIQRISDKEIKLLRLLTADDPTRCEVFNKTDLKRGVHVRVTGGFYKGCEGTVQRVKKNKRVLVEIEGICLILLPYIHPDLLEVIQDRTE